MGVKETSGIQRNHRKRLLVCYENLEIKGLNGLRVYGGNNKEL